MRLSVRLRYPYAIMWSLLVSTALPLRQGGRRLKTFVLLSTLAQLFAGAKPAFQLIFDTTCSDCQEWMRGQFLPIWKDPSFHDVLADAYEFRFLAHSVTKHEQGPHLNQVVNCASAHLALEDFLSAMGCWEGNVEAWAPVPGSDRFEQHMVDIDDVMSRCMPSHSMARLKECSESDAEGRSLRSKVRSSIPSNFNEVPWLTINGTEFSMFGGDNAGIYHLKETLCQQWQASALPSNCTQTSLSRAPTFMAKNVHLRAVSEHAADERRQPWSCRI